MNADDNANQAPPAEEAKPIPIIFIYKDETRGVLQEVARERMRQDEQHGGPPHDDTHTQEEWLSIIDGYLIGGTNYRQNLVKVAATATAALEAFDRRSTPSTPARSDERGAM
jgi:hypothetical protein